MKVHCAKCGYSFVNPHDLLAHIRVHRRTHRPAMSFLTFIGKRSGTFVDDKTFSDIPTDVLLEYKEEYEKYLHFTCKNTPCDGCMSYEWGREKKIR